MPVVEQPHLTPSFSGLIASARIVTETDQEPNPQAVGGSSPSDSSWVGGISFRPEDCDSGSAVALCGASSIGNAPTQATNVDTHFPIFVEAETDASTFGNVLAQADMDRAKRKLLAVQSYQLEKEFWTGAVATAAGYTHNQYLAISNPTLIEGGDALGTLTALAELEQFVQQTFNEVGMIHAQPRTVIYWLNNGAVSLVNGLIRTALGTIIVPGSGYPGTGPGGLEPKTSGTHADRSWVFATSLVYVRLGDIVTPDKPIELYDRAMNRRYSRAYRAASANFTGCAIGACLVAHNVAERTTTGS